MAAKKSVKKSKKVKLELFLDESCEMEKLEVNGECVGYGNAWDEHCDDRFDGIRQALTLLGIPFTEKVNRNWKSEDDE